MGKKLPAGRERFNKTPADEVEIKKSVSRARKVLSSFRNEFRRRRNKNALWKF